MNSVINFGIEDFRQAAGQLDIQVDFGPDGESSDKTWKDLGRFRDWLETLDLGNANTEALIGLVPQVSLVMNHGPLFGVERFMAENSESDHMVLEAGFIIVGTGPNGDFIVVDTLDGSGRTGWLPMAKVWGMSSEEVRNHFIPTNDTLGAFVRASEEAWHSVPKDWNDAKEHMVKTV